MCYLFWKYARFGVCDANIFFCFTFALFFDSIYLIIKCDEKNGGNMKKFLNAMLALCLIVSCMFVLTACGGDNGSGKNYADAVAGKYSGTVYESYGSGSSEMNTTVLDIKKDGKFTLTMTTVRDVLTEIVELNGSMVVSKENKVTSVKFDNFGQVIDSGNVYMFGNLIPKNQEDNSDMASMVAAIEKIYAEMFKENLAFSDSYVLFILGENIQILYKENTQKLAENTVLRIFTEKETNDFEKSLSFDEKLPVYEADYYLVKNTEFNLADETMKKDLIDILSEETVVIKTDYYGNAEFGGLEITDVEGFDLTTAGSKTATIKYMNQTTEVSKQVSYIVVESEEDLPRNQVKDFELYNNNKIIYLNQADSLYKQGYRLEYNTFGDSSSKYVDINETNCIGANKVVNVTGYDNTKEGYQVVSFEYRGKVYKQAFFIYNETVDPIKNISKVYECRVEISRPENTVRIVNPELTISRMSGATEKATLTMDWAINKKNLQDYKDGDQILFEYKYNLEGKEYSYLLGVRVVINETQTA